MDINTILPDDLTPDEAIELAKELVNINAQNVVSLGNFVSEPSIDLVLSNEEMLSEVYKPLVAIGTKGVKENGRKLEKILRPLEDDAMSRVSANSGRLITLQNQFKERVVDVPTVFSGDVGIDHRQPERTAKGRKTKREVRVSLDEPELPRLPQPEGIAVSDFTTIGTDEATRTTKTVAIVGIGETAKTSSGIVEQGEGKPQGKGGESGQAQETTIGVFVPKDMTYGGGVVITPPVGHENDPIDWNNCRKTETGWICPPIKKAPVCYDVPGLPPPTIPPPIPTCPKPEGIPCPDGYDWWWNNTEKKWQCTLGGNEPPPPPKPEPVPPSCEDLMDNIKFNIGINCEQLPDTYKKRLAECGFKVCDDGKDVNTGKQSKLTPEWTALLVRVTLAIGWTF